MSSSSASKKKKRGAKQGALFDGVWQQPFVDVFKQLHLAEGQHCAQTGDVDHVLDRTIGKKVFHIKGSVPAANLLTIPCKGETLGLTGKYFYVQLRVNSGKFFTVHVDVTTTRRNTIRLSFSNLYKKVKVTDRHLSFPALYFTSQKWTVFALDLFSLLQGYTNEEFASVRGLQFSSTLRLRSCFSSDTMYAAETVPREMSFPLAKGQAWKDCYDWLWVYSNAAQKQDEMTLKEKQKQTPKNENQRHNQQQEQQQQAVSPSPYAAKPSQQPHLPMYPSTSSDSINQPSAQFLSTVPSSSSGTKQQRTYAWQRSDKQKKKERNSAMPAKNVLQLTKVVGYTSQLSQSVTWAADGRRAFYTCDNAIISQDMTSGEQSVFMGHTAPIATMELSPNGKLLASAQSGKSAIVRIWDPLHKECLTHVCAHSKDLVSLSFSHDSRYLVGVGQDNHSRVLLVIWDVTNVATSGQCPIVARQVSEWSISRIRFVPNPDPTHQLVSCGKENIRFWRIKNGHLPAVSVTLNEHSRHQFTDLAFESPIGVDDGTPKRIFVSTADGSVFQVSQQERLLECIYHLHEGPINCLSVTDAFCVTGSSDGFLRVWPLDFSDYYMQAQHTKGVAVHSIHISPDGLKVLSGCSNGSIGVLDLATTEYASKVRSHAAAITGIAVDPHPSRDEFTTVSADGTIRVWDAHNFKQIYEFQSPTEHVTCVAYDPSPDQYRVVCGFDSGYIRVCDVSTTSIAVSYKQHGCAVVGVAFSATGGLLFSRAANGHICVYDTNNNYQPIRMLASVASIPSIVKSAAPPTSASPASASSSTADAESKSAEAIAAAAGEWCWDVAPNGKYLAVASSPVQGVAPTSIVVYSCPALYELHRIDVDDSGGIARFSFSASSRELLVLMGNGRARRVSMTSGATNGQVSTVPKNASAVLTSTSMAVSPNGRYVVVGTRESVLKVWDYYDTNSPVSSQHFSGHLGYHDISATLFCAARPENAAQYGAETNVAHSYVLSIAGSSIAVWEFVGEDTRQRDFEEKKDLMQATPSKELFPTGSNGKKATKEEMEQHAEERRAQLAREEEERKEQELLKKKQHQKSTNATFLLHCPPKQPPAPLASTDDIVDEGILSGTVTVGFNGYVRNNVTWCEQSGLVVYSCGNQLVVEALAATHDRIQTLRAHIHDIAVLARSADGRFVATGASSSSELEPSIRVWDLATGAHHVLQAPPAHVFNGVQSLMFIHEDSLLVAVSNNSVRDHENMSLMSVWRWADGALVALAQLPSSVRNLVYQHSTDLFFTCGPHLIQWAIDMEAKGDRLSSEIIYTASDSESVRCLANSPLHPSLIFGGSDNGQVYIWEVTSTASRLATSFVAAPRTAIQTIQAFANSTLIVGDSSGVLTTWSYQGERIRTSKFIKSRSTQLGKAGITSAYFEASSNVGVVGTRDATVWFVDHEAATYNLIGQANATTHISSSRLVSIHSSYVNDLVFDSTGKFIASAGSDGSLRLWKARDTVQALHFQVANEACLSVSFSPDAKLLAASFSDGCVRIVNMQTLQLQSKIELASQAPISRVQFLQNEVVLCGSASGLVFVVDALREHVDVVVEEHKGAIIQEIAVEPIRSGEGTHWLIADSIGRMSVWETDVDGRLHLRHFKQVNEDATAGKQQRTVACFSPIELGVVICAASAPDDESPCLRFFNYLLGQWETDISLSHTPLSLTVPKDGVQVILGNADGTLSFVTYPGGPQTPSENYVLHAGAVHAVCVNPHGDMVASGSFSQLQLSSRRL